MRTAKTICALASALAATAVWAAPEPICNDEWSIKPGASQTQLFTLSKEAEVLIEVRRVQHADKGFTVHVIPKKLYIEWKSGHVTYKGLTDANSETATAYRRVTKLAAGEWAVMVVNSENALHRMIVHARVVVNPGPEERASLGL